jgi:hypothetical protein
MLSAKGVGLACGDARLLEVAAGRSPVRRSRYKVLIGGVKKKKKKSLNCQSESSLYVICVFCGCVYRRAACCEASSSCRTCVI